MPVTFSEASTATFPQPVNGGRMIFIDADGDGDMDILYQTGANGTVYQYARSNGDGTYTILALGSSPFAGLTFPDHNGGNLHVGDIDGDGDFDIWAGNPSGPGTGSYFRNDGATFSSQPTTSFPSPSSAVRAVMADFDNDGDADILYQTGTSGSPFQYGLNNGDGTYTLQVQADSPFAGLTMPATSIMHAADFDGDGDIDVWLAVSASTGNYYQNNGGVFSSPSSATMPAPTSASRTVVGDFDSDGDADILYQIGSNGSAWQYARSNGDGTFTILSQAASPFAGVTLADHNGSNAIAGDVDGDGDDDLIITPDGTTGEFYLASGKPPELASSTPADNTTGVSVTANIVLTFDESVTKGSGNFYIYRYDGILIETISVGSAQVTGSGTTWTIDPSVTLQGQTGFYVLADAGIFIDTDGSEFAGIGSPTTLNFTTTNVAPTINNLNGDHAFYFDDGAAVRIDAQPSAVVFDADSPDFAGGTLTVTITSGGVAGQDVLGVDPSYVTIVGSSVSVSGVQIGTVTGGSGGSPYVFTFNANATGGHISTLIRGLTYNNSAGTPTGGDRTIQFTVTDGDGGSASASTTLHIRPAGAADAVVISEVQVAGSVDSTAEFIELHNTTGAAVDISGWTLCYRSASGSTDQLLVTFPAGTVMAAGAFLLIGSDTYSGSTAADFSYGTGILNGLGGGIGLRAGPIQTGAIIDSLAYGTAQAGHVFREGSTAMPGAPGAGQSLVRTGYSNDTGLDFALDTTPGPQNSASPVEIVGGNVPTPGDDTLTGTTGADTIDGGAGDDEISGGDGDDYLKGGAGADHLIGGAGNDTYVVDNFGDDTDETGGSGVDLVWSRVSWALSDDLENLTLGAGGGAIDGEGNELGNIITGNDFANTLWGRDGDDSLIGAGGIDNLYGGDGTDNLDGGLQDDFLDGGDGDDTIIGGGGNDYLRGGDGADHMEGGAGNDFYAVDDLGDTVSEAGGSGTDTVQARVSWTLGTGFENLILGSAGGATNGTGNELRNTITGNYAANTLHGMGEVDTLYGDGGDDTLYGDAGNDVLYGENGYDTLYGGDGSDKLYGGAHADRFVFTDLDIHRSGLAEVPNKDQILDLSFTGDHDIIDLSAIDANTTLGGDQGFTFVTAFTKVAGQATLTFNGSVSTLTLDVDGDGKADLRIEINGDLTGSTGNLYTGVGDPNGGWLL